MRVLVADLDATLLAAVAGAFAGHIDLATATGRDRCIALLEEREFDVVVACDRLNDCSGLELLGEVAGVWPETLRIFAASPARLQQLEGRLGLFGLLATLSYPIDARKLLPALAQARRRLEIATAPANVRHVILEEDDVAGDIGAEPPPAEAVPSTSSSERRCGVQKAPPPRQPTVISAARREAFQRAVARRRAAEAGIAAAPPEGVPGAQSSVVAKKQRTQSQHWSALNTGVTRAAPSSGSLSGLAQLATAGRPLKHLGVARDHSKRAILFIGGGVLAALAVVALNFASSGAKRESIKSAQVTQLVPPPSLFSAPESDGAGSANSQQQDQQASLEAQATPANLPPESVNPDTAPPDPPPPPALERPGPMEPPSSMMPSYASAEESQ